MNRQLIGFYRAKVVDNKDNEKFGRVKLWIPDIMPDVDQTEGLWARPANNPVGGRNVEEDTDHHYMGTLYIPKKGSWVWVFFEAGNINKPYYWNALDLENTMVLPEGQLGTKYWEKWVIFKSHEGRTIVISDDPDDARVEITGKKRSMISTAKKPTGDTNSVYTIDDNQTTVLFDERTGKEKVLIRSHKGDFFHFDIDERKLHAFFESDIELKTNGAFRILAKDDIDIKSSDENVRVEGKKDVDIKSVDDNVRILAKDDVDIKSTIGDISIHAPSGVIDTKSGLNINQSTGGNINQKASTGSIKITPSAVSLASGQLINLSAPDIGFGEGGDGAGDAGSATDATGATDANPQGERDT